ncbi:MAG: hypothetical protein M1170_01045 [Patescibacteria group bacterium]|nr:hypothetical protein [Patescibacteria group bacterium]
MIILLKPEKTGGRINVWKTQGDNPDINIGTVTPTKDGKGIKIEIKGITDFRNLKDRIMVDGSAIVIKMI